jgi:hypothetical protein
MSSEKELQQLQTELTGELIMLDAEWSCPARTRSRAAIWREMVTVEEKLADVECRLNNEGTNA